MLGVGRAYAFQRTITNLVAARALLQIQAPTNKPIVLYRAYVGQSTSEVSAQNAMQIIRLSVNQTVTAAEIATDIRPLNPNDAASTVQVGTAATGYVGTTNGTISDTLVNEAFNWVGGGWLWFPAPEGRIIVPVNGLIALQSVEAFTGTVHCGIEFFEL